MFKRFDVALAIGLLCSLLFSGFSSFAKDCDQVRHNVVRLHILANSDSPEDQELKLAVRDAILADTAYLFSGSDSKEQAEILAAAHLQDIEAAARAELLRQGSDYGVSARIVNRYFDTREYDDFTMPAGYYDAVQVEIGSGQGKNWWCVMFPPLCLPAVSEKESSPLEEQILTLGQSPCYKPAFAVVEAIEFLQHQKDNNREA